MSWSRAYKAGHRLILSIEEKLAARKSHCGPLVNWIQNTLTAYLREFDLLSCTDRVVNARAAFLRRLVFRCQCFGNYRGWTGLVFT